MRFRRVLQNYNHITQAQVVKSHRFKQVVYNQILTLWTKDQALLFTSRDSYIIGMGGVYDFVDDIMTGPFYAI